MLLPPKYGSCAVPSVALLDTNVWVSALLNPSGYPARIIAAWRDDRFTTVSSLPLLDELAEVLNRPRLRIRYQLSTETIITYVSLIRERAVLVEPTGQLHLCRDPDDDMVLETALLGQAQYAVSRDDDLKGDHDLVEQMRGRGIAVVSVQQFLTILTAPLEQP